MAPSEAEETSSGQNQTLTEEEVIAIRATTKSILEKLDSELKEQGSKARNDVTSWLNGSSNRTNTDTSTDISDQCHYFDTFGFLHIPRFSSPDECHAMKDQMKHLCQENWHPSQQGLMSFSTDVESNKEQGSNDYFLDSASRIHFFAEASALADDGVSLKPDLDKFSALNKAGHALHTVGPFRTYTRSERVRSLVTDLGWRDPVVPQSMYICKNPKIGSAVHSHQDATFLYTAPRQTCLGMWLALDDATLNNGCLWVRPYSHSEPLRRQFYRNPEHFTEEQIAKRSNLGKGDPGAPKMIFREFGNHQDSKVSWEGSLPKGSEPPSYDGLFEAGFVPIECRAGDLLCFAGTLDHLSLPNRSDQPRHTFQLHLVEGPKQNIEWSPQNWLQYPPGKEFTKLIDD